MSPLLITALLLAIPSSALVFNENVHRVQVSGSQCVLDVAHKFFDNYSTIALVRIEREIKSNLNVGISTDDLITQQLFNDGSWTIMMKYFGHSQTTPHLLDFGFEKIHNYVLVVQSLVLLERVLEQLSRAVAWNPHANFLVYVDGIVEEWQQFCTDLIGSFWQYWVINLTIMIPSVDIYGHLFVSWFPFNDGNCGQEQVTLTTLGICKDSKLEPSGFQCFPNKVPRDLNRCPVLVGTVNSPPFVVQKGNNSSLVDLDSGIEMKVMQTVAWRANFEVALSVSYMADPQSGEGIFQELLDKRINLAIGTIAPTIETHRMFDFSVQYTQDKATWVVPADVMMPQWLALLLVFQPSAYAATFALLVFFWVVSSTIVRVFRDNFRREHQCYRNPVSLLIITVGILFSNIPSKFPKTKFLKYLLVIWLLFCLHWSTAYSSTLMSVLTSNVFSSGIETEAEILELKLNLSITNRTMRYFNRLSNDANEVIPTMLCPSAEKCLQEMGEKRDSALAMSRINFEFIKDQLRDGAGNYHVKSLKTDIVTSPIELLSKGSPLLPRINEILLDIIESGLIDYWTRNITRDQATDTDKGQKILRLENLQGGFFLLAIGLTISFVVFIAEIGYHNHRK